MMRSLWIAAFILFYSISSVAAVSFISIRLSNTSRPFRIGEEIYVDVLAKNITSHDLDIGGVVGGQAEFLYKVYVWDSRGNLVPKTPYGQRVYNEVPFAPGQVVAGVTSEMINNPIHPQQTARDRISLSDLFLMNSPGIYKVQVRRRFPEDGGDFVTSNAILVRVIR